jgi:hypothetical protein
MEKLCTLCHEKKSLDHFGKHKLMKDGHLNQCKVCRKEYTKAYQTKNKEKLSEKSKQYYKANKEQIKERVRTHWNENANEINEKRRERYNNDEEYHTKRLNECSKSNAKCRPERRKKAKEEKSAAYYLELCRKRMWHAFNGREVKSDKTKALLGCDGEFLKKYLETTKVPGKDYSNAHIDHIVPCSSFDFSHEEQQRKCFHYTNLQLLPAHENLAKSNKQIILPKYNKN